MVLSDELQIEYYRFKNNENYNRDKIKRLLCYFKGPILTNLAQVQRTNVNVERRILSQLLRSTDKNKSLIQLAKTTNYKIILSDKEQSYPFVNINNDKIENNLTGTFYKSQSREKAIKHLNDLCLNAKSIIFYDRYFSCSEDEKNIECFKAVFPKQQINFRIRPSHISPVNIKRLKRYCDKWEFIIDHSLEDHHDRYIVIDNEIEIIMTSGWFHLANSIKDFTYIVKCVTYAHF